VELPMTGRRRSARERGVVLPLVLIIGVLLTAAIATFVRRSVVDKLVVGNRTDGAAAATLAQGGVQIALAVLFQNRLQGQIDRLDGEPVGATLDDLWARLGEAPLTTEWGGQLVIRIEDSGARLNLNSLVPATLNAEESKPGEEAEEYLVDVLERVMESQRWPEGRTRPDPRELARNLLDYMDLDDVAIDGRNENDYYLAQDPPYEAANRPLLSVGEIAMVEGFDAEWADLLRPYVTVHPLVGQTGIDVNTAPPHVLGLLYYGSSGNMRLADADLVRDILKERDAGRIVCTATELFPERCVPLAEVGLGEGAIYPPVNLPVEAVVFTVVSEATVGEVVHSIQAVFDLTDGRNPRLLSWRAL
jgi:general secretion pathway protein K